MNLMVLTHNIMIFLPIATFLQSRPVPFSYSTRRVFTIFHGQIDVTGYEIASPFPSTVIVQSRTSSWFDFDRSFHHEREKYTFSIWRKRTCRSVSWRRAAWALSILYRNWWGISFALFGQLRTIALPESVGAIPMVNRCSCFDSSVKS